MNYILTNRVINEAKYLLNNDMTIREISKIFKVSKSTVHKDLNKRLIHIDPTMYLNVNKVLDYHKKIRHIRGGEATKIKYRN